MAPKNTEDQVYRLVERGILEIDEEGRVWRITKKGRRRAEKEAGDYLQVRAMFNGVRFNALAHRLVWRHFHGPIPVGLTVNHEDGNKKRNHPDNLELATYSEQQLHAMRVLGKNQHPLNQDGFDNHASKLTEQALTEIAMERPAILSEMKSRHGHRIARLAEKYGVRYQCVWEAVHRMHYAVLTS